MDRKMKIVAAIAVAAVVLLAGVAIVLNQGSSKGGTDDGATTRQITDMDGRLKEPVTSISAKASGLWAVILSPPAGSC